jgi:S-adenosylmethionine synthetase
MATFEAETTRGKRIVGEVKGFDLRPKSIIKLLGLKKPIFEKTAEWGHFGNQFKWDICLK